MTKTNTSNSKRLKPGRPRIDGDQKSKQTTFVLHPRHPEYFDDLIYAIRKRSGVRLNASMVVRGILDAIFLDKNIDLSK